MLIKFNLTLYIVLKLSNSAMEKVAYKWLLLIKHKITTAMHLLTQ